MKTLIVSSYHGKWAARINPLVEAIARSSEYEVIRDIDVAAGYETTGFSAVVLSGSPNLISKNEYLVPYARFIRLLQLPTLGICYGHQLMAKAFGAKVFDSGRMIEGDYTVRVLELEPLFKGLGDEIIVRESHREYVASDTLANAGFDLIAVSETCPVEAIHHIERPLFGVQFHPERSGEVGRQVIENFLRYARNYQPCCDSVLE
ncbi:MAG: gamma-glutamyl-gamma-aminobutyrate hydrolase family protein [candidate division WOR-3 bacterium]